MIDGFYKRQQNTGSCAACRLSTVIRAPGTLSYGCAHPDAKITAPVCPIDAQED